MKELLAGKSLQREPSRGSMKLTKDQTNLTLQKGTQELAQVDKQDNREILSGANHTRKEFKWSKSHLRSGVDHT